MQVDRPLAGTQRQAGGLRLLGAVEAQKRKPRVFADRAERAYGYAAGRDLGAGGRQRSLSFHADDAFARDAAMLHARHDLLTDEAAFVEIDAGEPIEHRLMRKGIAKRVVAPPLRHAKGDAVCVILILRGDRAAEIARIRLRLKQDAQAEGREARIGIGDGAVGKPGRRAPGRGYGEGRILGDLDLGSELVEAAPLRKLAGLRLGYFEQKAVSCRDNKKIEKNFPLRREQAGMDGAAKLRLVDIVGDQPLQKAVRGRPRDPHDRTVGKNRRVALAHGHALETYSGGRKPASSSESLILPETFDLLIKGATLVNHAGQGLADIGVKDGSIVAIGGLADTSAGRTIEA